MSVRILELRDVEVDGRQLTITIEATFKKTYEQPAVLADALCDWEFHEILDSEGLGVHPARQSRVEIIAAVDKILKLRKFHPRASR